MGMDFERNLQYNWWFIILYQPSSSFCYSSFSPSSFFLFHLSLHFLFHLGLHFLVFLPFSPPLTPILLVLLLWSACKFKQLSLFHFQLFHIPVKMEPIYFWKDSFVALASHAKLLTFFLLSSALDNIPLKLSELPSWSYLNKANSQLFPYQRLGHITYLKMVSFNEHLHTNNELQNPLNLYLSFSL